MEKKDAKALLSELERIYTLLYAMKEQQDKEFSTMNKEIFRIYKQISASLPVDPVVGVLGEDIDELYPDAYRLVIKAGSASTAQLQRLLGVGYARAAHLIDMLEERGVVGPAQGGAPREVLLTPAAMKVLKKIESALKKKDREKK